MYPKIYWQMSGGQRSFSSHHLPGGGHYPPTLPVPSPPCVSAWPSSGLHVSHTCYCLRTTRTARPDTQLTPSISESRFWFACPVVLFVWGLLVCLFWFKLAFIFSGQGADHFHTSQNKLAIIRPFGWYFSILYKCFLKLGMCLCVSECPPLNTYIWRPEHDATVFLYYLSP